MGQNFFIQNGGIFETTVVLFAPLLFTILEWEIKGLK